MPPNFTIWHLHLAKSHILFLQIKSNEKKNLLFQNNTFWHPCYSFYNELFVLMMLHYTDIAFNWNRYIIHIWIWTVVFISTGNENKLCHWWNELQFWFFFHNFPHQSNKNFQAMRSFVVLLWIKYSITFQGGPFLLQLFDEFVGGTPNVVIGIFMCVGLAWVYKVRHFCTDLRLMLSRSVSWWWRAMWCCLSPVIMIVSWIFM